MTHDPEKYRKIYESLSKEEVAELNDKDHQEHIRQVELFKAGYAAQSCYLCGKPFRTISKDDPCLHWLLRQCKFKKKDFPLVFNKYGYGNIASFIRWCANQERLLSNINDLEEEKSSRKVVSYTVRWKNIEWTFDCTENDLRGHTETKVDYPHYHFQMRIDGRPFIDFNDFHLPFTDHDLFVLSLRDSNWFHQGFGAIGSGMQDAVSVPMDMLLEHIGPADDEEDATYHLSTMIDASENPISGEEIYEIQQEAERTGRSFAYVAQRRLKDRAKVTTVVSPADTIPDIAQRTEHRRR